MLEIFHTMSRSRNMRFSAHKFDLLYRNSRSGQKSLTFFGPRLYNTLPSQIKLLRSVNTFKHDLKRLFFHKLRKENDNICICYYRLYMYSERRSASETAIEFVFHHFNHSEPTYKSERMQLLNVIAASNQLNVNALN